MAGASEPPSRIAMHLFDRAFWRAIRVLPEAPGAPWLEDLPLDLRGPVGADWPMRQAQAQGRSCAPARALIPDADVLGQPLPPMVRCFYERTEDFTLTVQASAGRLIGLWERLFTARWDQLQLPRDDAQVVGATVHHIDGEPGRVWVMRHPDGRVVFVGRYDVVRPDGQGPHVRIVFPVPGGFWVVLFRAQVVDGRLELTEEGGRPGGAGLYLVPTHGRPRYVSFLREFLCLVPGDDGIEAVHTFDFARVRILTLRYTVCFRPGASRDCPTEPEADPGQGWIGAAP